MAGCGVAGDEDRRSREIRRHSLEVLIKKFARSLKSWRTVPITAEKKSVGLRSATSSTAPGRTEKPSGKICAVFVCACLEHCSEPEHSSCLCSRLKPIFSM